MGIRLGEIQGLVVPGTVALGLVTSVTLRPEAERRRLGARRGGWGMLLPLLLLLLSRFSCVRLCATP